MNILTFCEAPWDDKNSFGNTISNLFAGEQWGNDCFSNIFCREQLPENNLNVDYYRLTSIDIVKGIAKFRIRGQEFSSNQLEALRKSQGKTSDKEKKRIDRIHKRKTEWIYYLNDLLWMSGIWINAPLKEFIARHKPDVFFAFATVPSSLLPLISYLKKNTDCKIVLFVTDDVIGSYEKYKPLRRAVTRKQINRCLALADKIYGISDEMAALYSNYSKKDVTVLHKGCCIRDNPKSFVHEPIKFVYAGNLLWGRDETLARLAKSLALKNQSGISARLEIYSSTQITPEMEEKLNVPGISFLMGAKTYSEITEIMKNSDVVLHVESMEKEYIDLVKCSFSTKIIDCFQSGALVLGIGPMGIASIEYLRQTDGVVIIDSFDEMDGKIEQIVNDKQKLLSNALLTRQFALTHLDIDKVRSKLRNDFISLVNE